MENRKFNNKIHVKKLCPNLNPNFKLNSNYYSNIRGLCT